MPDPQPQGTFQIGGQFDQAFTRPGQWSGVMQVGLQLTNWHLLPKPLFGQFNVQDPQFQLQMSAPAALSAQIGWSWWKTSYTVFGNKLDLAMQSQLQRQQSSTPAQSQWMVQYLQGQAPYNFG